MPEGPEVGKVVKGLKFLEGKEIKAIFRTPLRPYILDDSFYNAIGDRIVSVSRLGKFIIFNHESSRKSVIHLSFTGCFSKQVVDYLAIKMYMDDESVLYFSDRRGLAKLRNLSEEEFKKDATLKAHKVDGLDSSKEELLDRFKYLRGRGVRKELKPFLLDFHNVCGIGNIYGSEICFESKLNPKVKFCDLTDEDLERLAAATKFILKRAYEAGGSSIESFVDLDGKPGHAQDFHMVYHKEVCPNCGTRIVQFKQDGRTTFYCPTCQGE